MHFIESFKSLMIGMISSILICICVIIGSYPFLLNVGTVVQNYSIPSIPDGIFECIFCNTAFANSSQNKLDNALPVIRKLTLHNFDITSVATNSKEDVLYVLGIEHKKEDHEVVDINVVFVVDTKAKKIVDKIKFYNKNLNLDNIVFDDKNNKIYGIGTKEIKNKEKLISTNFVFQISLLQGKNKIIFNNISTSFSHLESEDGDDAGILDIGINTRSNTIYILMENDSRIDGQNITSAEQYQISKTTYNKINKQQIYVIPYGDKLVSDSKNSVNYVLFNSIKSSDKDIIFVLNESTGKIIKSYTLSSLNSRNPIIDSNKGKLYILGDYFTHDDDIKGLSKQSEIITIIDTNSNNMTTFSLGPFTIKDLTFSPKNDVLYAVSKDNMQSQQQKSNANYLLEINPKTNVINYIKSIQLVPNYVVFNDISQTISILGKDPSDDENKILFFQHK